MDHTSSVPTLKLWSEGWTPKTLCCESQWGLHSRISLDYRKQAVLQGHRRTLYGYSLGLSAENSHLPVFTRKGLTAYPTSCCLRSNFQITLTYMLTAIFPGTWKTWWALPLPSPFGSFQQWNQVTSITLEGACSHIWCSNFYGCHPRDRPPNHPVLITNDACISHRTRANKETVF